MSDQDNTAQRASELIDRWRSAHEKRPDWGEAIAKTEEALAQWHHPHGRGPITVTYSTPHLTAYALTQWLAQSIGQLDAPGRHVEVWGGPTPRLDDPDDPEGHDDAVLTLRVDTSDGPRRPHPYRGPQQARSGNAMTVRTPLTVVDVTSRRIPRHVWVRVFAVMDDGEFEPGRAWLYAGCVHRCAWRVGRLGFGFMRMPRCDDDSHSPG